MYYLVRYYKEQEFMVKTLDRYTYKEFLKVPF